MGGHRSSIHDLGSTLHLSAPEAPELHICRFSRNLHTVAQIGFNFEVNQLRSICKAIRRLPELCPSLTFSSPIMLAVERPAPEPIHDLPLVKVGVPNTYQGFIQHSIETYRGKLTEYVLCVSQTARCPDMSMIVTC